MSEITLRCCRLGDDELQAIWTDYTTTWVLCVMAFITNYISKFLVVSREQRRLADGRRRVDEDAGGERDSQREDAASPGRHPEE